MLPLSKIDYVLYSKKDITATPAEVNYFDTTAGTNLPTPNTLPQNWKKFMIETIKLFINPSPAYSTTDFVSFMKNSYFQMTISNYVILEKNITELLDFKWAHTSLPLTASNVYEISDATHSEGRGFLKLEKPIVLEPNINFTFKIYFASYANINGANTYLLLRGILEKEISG